MIGTPSSIPGKPHRPPNTRIANTTQKEESPVESPRIFGPIIFPSTCCKMITKIRKYNPCTGFCKTIMIKDGIAPIKGPKNGMILVTPMITATSMVSGIFMIASTI